MNSPILNRDFSHPADGWYQIEPKGEHPNRAAGVIQVIDDAAMKSIVERFNQEAAAGKLRHGNEMLIDHEHFSDQPDKETRAYGWLTDLQVRSDGIYGRVRWSKTGKEAVDGGDYRFFSTEYEAKDCEEGRGSGVGGEMNAELGTGNAEMGKNHREGIAAHGYDASAPHPGPLPASAGRGSRKSVAGESALDPRPSTLHHVRPMRLAGLTLTNMNNNRGQKPITNRGSSGTGILPVRLETETHGQDARASSENSNQTKHMNTVAIKLGLAGDVSEEIILAEVSRLLNRVTDLIPHEEENKSLRERLGAIDGEQVHTLLDLHGVRDEKIRNRLKPVLMGLKNREERVGALLDFGFKPEERRVSDRQPPRLLNRGEGRQPRSEVMHLNEQALAQRAEAEIGEYKIRNRCTYAEARNAVRGAKPELFGLEKK